MKRRVMETEYTEKIIKHFDLDQIGRSGQCFRMEKIGKYTHVLTAGRRFLTIRQKGDRTRFYCKEEEFETFWKEYFDLGTDYVRYMEAVNPNDAYLTRAVAFGSGMRILKQDLWETIVSFLISQQNNIVRIRRCIASLCERYGERIPLELSPPLPEGDPGAAKYFSCAPKAYYAFPRPEALCALDEEELKACNLGYRSKYVVRAARSVVSGDLDLDAVCAMSYKKAKEELLTLFGVGEKVADCICLFALHHLEAFPRDTHIIKAMEEHYKRGFPNRRYRGFQGVMQQYIFYYELCGKPSRS